MIKKNIGELLLEYGLIDENDLKEGLEYQRKRGLRLGEALVELGKVSYEDIEYILSRQLDLPFVILDEKSVNGDLLESLPPGLMKEHNFIPLYENDEVIAIAIDDPFNSVVVEELSKIKNKKVKLSVANGRKIKSILSKFFKDEIELSEVLKTRWDFLRKSGFYRLDFFKRDNHVEISAYNYFFKKKLISYSSHKDLFDELKSFFDSRDYDFCFYKTENEKCTFIAVYPVERTVRDDIKEDIIVAGKFGLINPGLIFSVDMKVYSKGGLFYSKYSVEGYYNLLLNDRFVYPEKCITTLENIFDEEFYYYGYIPIDCDYCENGCEKCAFMGAKFKWIEGKFNKRSLIALMEKENGKN